MQRFACVLETEFGSMAKSALAANGAMPNKPRGHLVTARSGALLSSAAAAAGMASQESGERSAQFCLSAAKAGVVCVCGPVSSSVDGLASVLRGVP